MQQTSSTNFVIILLVLAVIAVIIYIMVKRRNSSQKVLSFKITNKDTADTSINVYLNSTEIDSSPIEVKAGETKTIQLEAKNPRTFKPYTIQQVKHIVVLLSNKSNLDFEPINIPKYSTVLSDNISGLAPRKTNVSNSWTDQGYYVLIFD